MKIIKKNQLTILVLALMLVTAGYLNYNSNVQNSTEVAAIGDQLLTDILGANRLDFTSILVNPLTEHDYSITFINRLIEKYIYGKLESKDLFTRGKYYE